MERACDRYGIYKNAPFLNLLFRIFCFHVEDVQTIQKSKKECHHLNSDLIRKDHRNDREEIQDIEERYLEKCFLFALPHGPYHGGYDNECEIKQNSNGKLRHVHHDDKEKSCHKKCRHHDISVKSFLVKFHKNTKLPSSGLK